MLYENFNTTCAVFICQDHEDVFINIDYYGKYIKRVMLSFPTIRYHFKLYKNALKGKCETIIVSWNPHQNCEKWNKMKCDRIASETTIYKRAKGVVCYYQKVAFQLPQSENYDDLFFFIKQHLQY